MARSLPLRAARHPSGFTLVELLVVIAIIGVLVGLLFPAVQAARESGRRSQCANNVKQLTLGLQTYHDAKKSLPPAALARYRVGGLVTTRFQSHNWGPTLLVMVLPFVEQDVVYNAKFPGKTLTVAASVANYPTTGDSDWRSVGATTMPSYLCPSDIGSGTPFNPTGVNAIFGGIAWARGNYVPNTGPGQYAEFAADGSAIVSGSAFVDGNPRFSRPGLGGTFSAGGPVGCNFGMTLPKLSGMDGSSKTIVLDEVRIGGGSEDPRGTWAMVARIPPGRISAPPEDSAPTTL